MEEKILTIAENVSNAEKFDVLKDLVMRVKKQIKNEDINGSQKLNEITVK